MTYSNIDALKKINEFSCKAALEAGDDPDLIARRIASWIDDLPEEERNSVRNAMILMTSGPGH